MTHDFMTMESRGAASEELTLLVDSSDTSPSFNPVSLYDETSIVEAKPPPFGAEPGGETKDEANENDTSLESSTHQRSMKELDMEPFEWEEQLPAVIHKKHTSKVHHKSSKRKVKHSKRKGKLSSPDMSKRGKRKKKKTRALLEEDEEREEGDELEGTYLSVVEGSVDHLVSTSPTMVDLESLNTDQEAKQNEDEDLEVEHKQEASQDILSTSVNEPTENGEDLNCEVVVAHDEEEKRGEEAVANANNQDGNGCKTEKTVDGVAVEGGEIGFSKASVEG
jgi:hypothetical protein